WSTTGPRLPRPAPPPRREALGDRPRPRRRLHRSLDQPRRLQTVGAPRGDPRAVLAVVARRRSAGSPLLPRPASPAAPAGPRPHPRRDASARCARWRPVSCAVPPAQTAEGPPPRRRPPLLAP